MASPLAFSRRALRIFSAWFTRQQGSAGDVSLRLNWPDGWHQLGMDSPMTRGGALSFPAVFASIDMISSDIARLPMRHWRDDGTTRSEVRNSWAIKVLDKPNDYQTGFDIMKMLIASQLYRGNGYLYPVRNGRFQIEQLHCLFPDNVFVYRTGPDYFYRVSAEPMARLETIAMIPPREMFHHRMLVLNDALLGITPMLAAATSSNAGLAILRSSEKFFQKMARPSGVLQTAGMLRRDAAEEIKERWKRVYAGEEGAGEVAVLEQGLEWKPLTMSAVDAQLIDQLRYSVEDVARVYRLPLFMLGDLTKVSFSSSEQLTRVYWTGCLSAHMESIEKRMSRFFGMDGRNEYLQYDLDALFRTEMQTRIEALAKAVQGGIRTPNEARRIEGLNAVDGGDTVFMQQQMVPVEALATRTDLAPKPQVMPPTTPPRELATTPLQPAALHDALMGAVFHDLPALRAASVHHPRQQRTLIHGRRSRAG